MTPKRQKSKNLQKKRRKNWEKLEADKTENKKAEIEILTDTQKAKIKKLKIKK